MTPKSFNQWKLENADMLADLLPEDCDICEGSGEHDCECGHTHTCRACHGTGRLNGAKDVSRDLYENYLKKDKEKLARWGREPIRS